MVKDMILPICCPILSSVWKTGGLQLFDKTDDAVRLRKARVQVKIPAGFVFQPAIGGKFGTASGGRPSFARLEQRTGISSASELLFHKDAFEVSHGRTVCSFNVITPQPAQGKASMSSFPGNDVSIHSRPVRRLTEAADGQGSCVLLLPEGRGYEKGFHRLRRLVNSSFPPEGGGLKTQRNF